MEDQFDDPDNIDGGDGDAYPAVTFKNDELYKY